jgi:hypothetical protein
VKPKTNAWGDLLLLAGAVPRSSALPTGSWGNHTALKQVAGLLHLPECDEAVGPMQTLEPNLKKAELGKIGCVTAYDVSRSPWI